jgi:predicted MFS family arabinose efflux permease
LRTFFTAWLLLTPFVLTRFGPRFLLIYLSAVTIAFAISRAIAMTGLLPWQQEYIPNDMRGKYSAYSSIFVSLAGLVAVGVAGLVLARIPGLYRYVILFGLGILFAIVSIYLASFIPGGAANRSITSIFQDGKEMLAPLRDNNFLRYLGALSLITLATGPVFSFLPLFMQDIVGLSASNVVLLQTGVLIGSLLSSYLWGWMADRYGSKPIALSGLLLITTLPVWWYLMPRESTLSLPVALGIALLQGIASSGWGIGSGRLLYVSIVPGESKTTYLSQYNAWMGLLGGLSAIFGGQLLDAFSGLHRQLAGFTIDSYTILFGIGLLLPLGAVLILRAVRTEQELSVGKFAGMFFQGNPLMAVESLIRFSFAREEPAAVAVTERLGKAGSPLTVDELLASLQDPRFYVRFEAIVSISRHRADPRLTKALEHVLDGNDPSLSVIAAWALGRIGDTSALPALRDCLQNSRYHSVQAHVARSLGSIGDRQSIPMLIDMIQGDTDMGVKVACASALGKLGAVQVTGDLLDILYRDRYPDSRREMSLALARLVNGEKPYITLYRKIQDDPGTALALQMENLKRQVKKPQPGKENPIEFADGAERYFARDELEKGLGLLAVFLKGVAQERACDHCRRILEECAARIKEFGTGRMEYVILAIVVAEKSAQEG